MRTFIGCGERGEHLYLEDLAPHCIGDLLLDLRDRLRIVDDPIMWQVAERGAHLLHSLGETPVPRAPEPSHRRAAMAECPTCRQAIRHSS